MNNKAYLYKWTHMPTGMWYLGSRTGRGCHPDDGYICSSKTVKPAIEQNPKDWTRIVLVIGDSEYIRNLERTYLTAINAKIDNMSFNKTNADTNFGMPGKMLSGDVRKKISNSLIGKSKGPMTVEHKRKLSLSKKGKTPCNKDKKETRLDVLTKMSQSHVGKLRGPHTEDAKKRIAESERITKQKNKLVATELNGHTIKEVFNVN